MKRNKVKVVTSNSIKLLMKSNNLDKITVWEDPDSNCSKMPKFIDLNTAIFALQGHILLLYRMDWIMQLLFLYARLPGNTSLQNK